jgi:hypothetical protein
MNGCICQECIKFLFGVNYFMHGIFCSCKVKVSSSCLSIVNVIASFMKYLFFLRYFLLYPIQTIDDIITLHNTLKNYLDMIDYLYNKENSSPLEIPQMWS